jgi:hypothetical protein
MLYGVASYSAFDESGQARESCGRNGELGWFGECVIYGSLARQLLVTRDPRMMDDFNWWDAKSSFGTISDKTIVSEVLRVASGDTACLPAPRISEVVGFDGEISERLRIMESR